VLSSNDHPRRNRTARTRRIKVSKLCGEPSSERDSYLRVSSDNNQLMSHGTASTIRTTAPTAKMLAGRRSKSA